MIILNHYHILFIEDRCQIGIIGEILRGTARVIGAGKPRSLTYLRLRAIKNLRECRHDPITEVIIVALIPSLIR